MRPSSYVQSHKTVAENAGFPNGQGPWMAQFLLSGIREMTSREPSPCVQAELGVVQGGGQALGH